jgi:hypothetical protein
MNLDPLYQDVPLDQTGNEIRLLEIIGGPDTALRCRFHRVLLTEQPQFIALSYTWGRRDLTKVISIDGYEVSIRENLWLFLCQARQRSQRTLWNMFRGCGPWKYLWVDALCINQSNIPEKNIQVSHMADIYSKVHICP